MNLKKGKEDNETAELNKEVQGRDEGQFSLGLRVQQSVQHLLGLRKSSACGDLAVVPTTTIKI